jgi:hypothetical protein
MIAALLEHADQIDLLLFGLNCIVCGAFIGLGAGAWIDSKGAVKSGPLCGVFDPEYGACMQNRGHAGLHRNVNGCQFSVPSERGRELTPEFRP